MKFKLIFFLVMICTISSFGWSMYNTTEFDCVTEAKDKFNSDCLQLRESLKSETDLKIKCCFYILFNSCVMKIAEEECGRYAQIAVKFFFKDTGIDSDFDECKDYDSKNCEKSDEPSVPNDDHLWCFLWIFCLTTTQLVLFVVFVFALIGFLSYMCYCCCRRFGPCRPSNDLI